MFYLLICRVRRVVDSGCCHGNAQNALNNTPTCLSPLLRAARVQWGFEKNGGYVTSDTDAVGDAYRTHHFVPSAAAASCEAIARGGDQINSGGTFQDGLLDGVRQGLCKMDEVDAALRVIMSMRMTLGLFDPVQGQPMLRYGASDIGAESSRQLNLLGTQRSLVLLKDGERMSGSGGAGNPSMSAQRRDHGNVTTVLPLAIGVRTAVLGPHYNASWVLVQTDSGDVCPSGGIDCIPTPIHQLRRFNRGGMTTGALGSYLLSDADPHRTVALREAALGQARVAEQVVLVLGIRSAGYGIFSCARKRRPGHETEVCKGGSKAGALQNFTDVDGPYGNVMHMSRTHSVSDGDAYVEAETHDRRHIDLPSIQQKLATAVVALGKPTVIVMINGGSVALPTAVVRASNVAVIAAGYPGTRGSEAIASSIFGTVAPPNAGDDASVGPYIDRFGRLPYTVLPQNWTVGNRMDEMNLAAPPGRTYKYLQDSVTAQFQFGAGLQLCRYKLELAHGDRHPVHQPWLSHAATIMSAKRTYKLQLTNLATSLCACEAVVMMFASPISLPTQPVDHPLLRRRQLVSFQKVGTASSGDGGGAGAGGASSAALALAPGQTVSLGFTVSALDLSIVDFGGSGDRVLAPGSYQLSWETGSDETSAVVRGVPLTITGGQHIVERYPSPAD